MDDNVIEKVIRKQYGDYEKDYVIQCGSVYLVKTIKKIVEEILDKIKK
jgi:hypothetical protein